VRKPLQPGTVARIPTSADDVEDRWVLVLSVDSEGQATVLVLAGRVLGKGPGEEKSLKGLTSLLQPL